MGDSVWFLIDVARINLAGTALLIESRCCRPSRRLKLNRKLWYFRNLSAWCGDSRLLSKPTSLSVRDASGGNGDTGGTLVSGWMPSIQYGSLNPIKVDVWKFKQILNRSNNVIMDSGGWKCCKRRGMKRRQINARARAREKWMNCKLQLQ